MPPAAGMGCRTTPLWFTTRVIEPGERSSSVGHDAGDAVVRPITRAARRPCARPGCPAPAHASLVFSYGTREVWLDRLGEPVPQSYDLCAPHAARTQPPHGWRLEDRRPADEQAASEVGTRPTAPIGGEQTVAVLAAALRAVPDLPASPDEPVTVTEDAPSPVLGHGAAPSDEPADDAPDEHADAAGPLTGPAVDAPGTTGARPASAEVAKAADVADVADVAEATPPAPKPILAARSRTATPPSAGAPAADW
jgi:hypothetical protein